MELIGHAELHIDAGPDRVWTVLADVAQWKTWMPGVRWAVCERAFASGGYVTIKPERRRQTAYHIERAESHVLALALTFGPLASLRRTWTLTPDGSGTLVTHTVEIAGPLRRWLVAGTAARLHADALSSLKALAAACTFP